MLLRAIAIVVSVLLHAWTGNAMWALLEKDKLKAFDLGDGLDVVLEPPALIASEVTAVGDSLSPSNQSQSAAAAVSAPPPAPLREKASNSIASNTRPPPPQEAATATAQEHSAQLPAAAAPELLPDVIDSSESETQAQVAVLGERKPPPPRAPALPPDELGDVITSQHSAIDDTAPRRANQRQPNSPGRTRPRPALPSNLRRWSLGGHAAGSEPAGPGHGPRRGRARDIQRTPPALRCTARTAQRNHRTRAGGEHKPARAGRIDGATRVPQRATEDAGCCPRTGATPGPEIARAQPAAGARHRHDPRAAASCACAGTDAGNHRGHC